ncbi:YiiG family protein [Stenotrophomonas pavanii]|uniref:YiiG family protein n=1 Tax=Stenotrophomonas pavanii TaxID=487698 RepID=UPI002893EBBB|nr:YiiG family protein [Stenotrophomonas pavanii]MDT3529836.1 YiiG family protein [Stenotrophomonas pavanii]
MSRTLSVAALAASLTIVLAACGSKAPATTGDAGPSSTPDASAASSDAQQQLTAKLNAYIGCFNTLDSKTHGSIESYTRWIKDVEAGPTGRETQVYGPFEISDYDMKQCDGPVTEAMAAKPALAELDAAAGHYQQALKALVPISKEAHDYYDRQDYEDDRFAKGKQLHAPLMAAFKEFVAASATFNAELERQNDAAQREQLKALEQAEGRTREYYRLAMMLEAKAIMDLMSEDDFDQAKARERLDAFNRISDEAHAKVADQEPGKLDWNSFEREAENFRREGKERLKRVSENTPYTDFERRMLDSPSMAPSGSASKLMQEYNSLVFQSNRQ